VIVYVSPAPMAARRAPSAASTPRAGAAHLAALLDEIREVSKPLDFQIAWVSRDENEEADALTWSLRQPGPAL